MKARISSTYLLVVLTVLYGVSCQLEESNYNARFKPFTHEFALLSGYNLLEPTETFILPQELTEISGLATVNDSILACVQDEAGVIYLYNLNQEKVVERHRFAGGGDFEGIEIVGDQAYVLKSNGNIYQYSFENKTTNTIKTLLKRANNAEGLSFDSLNNRLLIACKNQAGLGGEKLPGKAVYSYNLATGFAPDPVFLITPIELEWWNEKQANPLRLTNRKKAFMPSAIAIHPESRDIFMLATVGKLLMVLSPTGKLKHVVPLSPRVFRQPEGICFTSSGHLIISNEGQDGNGKIHLFRKETIGMPNTPNTD